MLDGMSLTLDLDFGSTFLMSLLNCLPSIAIAMLGRQFNRLIRKVDPKSRSNVKDIPSNIGRPHDSSRRFKSEDKESQSREIQCHGCEGYGHIRAECPTVLKKQRKGMTVTWSDGESG